MQLNAPYPAPYYLKSFLESRGHETLVWDHSIALFDRIFCRAGLERIFHEAGKMDRSAVKNKTLLYNVDRFLSEEDRWLSYIDPLIDFLRGNNREFGHFLALANGVLPGGPRFDACLGSPDRNPPPDAAPLLASKLLSDLVDFITVTVDPSFSLIRYSTGVAGTGFRDFSAVEKGLEGYILREFYRPLLEDAWDTLDRSGRTGNGGEPLVIGATIPFPGCLTGALVCAASAKARYGDRVITIAGGGYVNTELRFMEEPKFFDYFDYLSFDRGYGSLAAILEHTGDTPVYKTKYRSRVDNRIVSDMGIDSDSVSTGSNTPCRFSEIDRESVRTVFPDYLGLDFSRYIRPVDDLNPMHRLWSDGRWLKAYLAHGCYWHACAFCDVQLDYIRCFEPLEPEALFRHLQDQAEKTGLRGIHLVDEAAPPDSLIRLALLNREAGQLRQPLIFWGNIRFEKDFTPDAAAVLAAGGLVGVSAGIEVAAPEGFRRIGKGIGLADVVNACAAFKEAGILTHAYLIYGYWDQDDREIIDSAEILRQLFEAGLLDSAFWHKFVLTRHSRIYAEWKRGKHTGLKIKGDQGTFALNDLSFEGEDGFDKFTLPLDQLLAEWMAGNTALPVEQGFPFRVPKPRIGADLVEGLLDEYARNRDRNRAEKPPDGARAVFFLGSKPVVQNTSRETALFWRWRLGDRQLRIGQDRKKGAAIALLLEEAAHSGGLSPVHFYERLRSILGNDRVKRAWKVLREGGLAVL
jgi:radical SAM superfamily enzyme YgiQ (UPF0313 family)